MQSTDRKGAVFLRNCRERGLCAIFLGVGIILAKILPMSVIVFVSALAIILLGLTWMRRH